MIRRPPRSTQSRSSAASDVYKRQDRYPPLFKKTSFGPRQRQRLHGCDFLHPHRPSVPPRPSGGTRHQSPYATPPPLPPPSPIPSPRWKVTTIQEYFPLNRQHSNDMMTKQPLPDGSIPKAYLRTLRTGKWDNGIDFSWLPPKQVKPGEDNPDLGPGPDPSMDSSAHSSSSNSHSSISSSSTNNINIDFCSNSGNSINISSNSSFIFRDSRSTSSNSSEDDST